MAGLRGVLPSAPGPKDAAIAQVHAMNVVDWKAVRSWSVAGENARSTDASEGRTCDVVLAITHLAPGGSLEVFDLAAEELRKQGLSVRSVALYRGRALSGTERHCHVLDDRESLDWLGYVRAFVRFARYMRSTRAAAVIGFMPAASVLGAMAGIMAGSRCRIPIHHQPAWAQRGMVQVIDRLLGAAGIYSHIVAVSDSGETSFEKYPHSYRRRISVIPNAVRLITPKSTRAAVRRRYGIPPRAILFASIGRLSREKNTINMIRAAGLVDRAYLVIAGDGPLREEAEALILDQNLGHRIRLLGQVDQQTVMDLLFASDAFVQLSYQEGRSLALLEALHAGKAIVTSEIPSQREVLRLEDGTSAGLHCNPDDVGAMAKTILAVAKTKKLRRELAARAAKLSARTDLANWGREYASLLRV